MQELMSKLLSLVGSDLAMKVAALVVADPNLVDVASILITDRASAATFIATFTPKPGGKVTTIHCGENNRNTLYFGCSWGDGSPPQGNQTGKPRSQKKPPEPWIEKEGKTYLADCWATIYKGVKKAGNLYSVPEGTVQKGRDWRDAGSNTCKILSEGAEIPNGCIAVHTSKVKGGRGPAGLLCLPAAVYRKGVEEGLIEKDEAPQPEGTKEHSGSSGPSDPFREVDFGNINL